VKTVIICSSVQLFAIYIAYIPYTLCPEEANLVLFIYYTEILRNLILSHLFENRFARYYKNWQGYTWDGRFTHREMRVTFHGRTKEGLQSLHSVKLSVTAQTAGCYLWYMPW